MKRSAQLLVVSAAPALLAAALWFPGQAEAAQPVVRGQGLKFTEYYEPPNDTHLKSVLEGASAQQQPDGRWLITGPKYQTFHKTGQGEWVVTAPECYYDRAERTLSSAGPLRVQTADGGFAIEGEGFTWQQTNATLLVSNQVHTTIHPEMFRTNAATPATNPPAAEAPGIEIFSDRFEFAQDAGRGVYEGNVRVTGTNLNATAGKLVVLLAVAEHRLQSLTAEERVVVDYEKIRATGERATYSADSGLVQLKGLPTWRMEDREGSGDELLFDRTNRVFQAMGHARLQIPAAGMGAGGLLSAPGSATASTPPPTNQVVEIRSDSYELRTNLAVFREQVRVTERLGEEVQGQMTCGVLTLTMAGTNELEKMVAERDVVIGQAERQFAAAKAEYTATNRVLELIGHPTWRDGPREGKGDSIRVNLADAEMLVRSNALMRLPAAEVGQAALLGTDTAQPSPSRTDTPGVAEITAQEYLLTQTAALFRGGVRIEHPQMKWACEELTMLSPPELGSEGRLLIAEPNVAFELQDSQGQQYQGSGRKAVYTRRRTPALTNDLMELTGTPAMLQATNLAIRNNVIILDLSKRRLATPGRYSFRGPMPETTTNLFPSWKSDRRR